MKSLEDRCFDSFRFCRSRRCRRGHCRKPRKTDRRLYLLFASTLLCMLSRPPVRTVSRVAWPAVTLYADRGVIVLNKPPGLICQTAPSTQVHLLQLTSSIAPCSWVITQDEPTAQKDDFSKLLDGKPYNTTTQVARSHNFIRPERCFRFAYSALPCASFRQGKPSLRCIAHFYQSGYLTLMTGYHGYLGSGQK